MFFLSPNQHHQSTEGKLFIANGKDTRLVTVHNGILWQGGHKPGKSGILRDFSEHEKLREFSENSVQPLRKTVTNKVFLVRHSNICVRFFDWVSRIIRNRDEVRVWWWPAILLELMWNDPWWRSLLHLLFITIAYGKVSLWLWESLENLEFFSPTLWPPCLLSLAPAFQGSSSPLLSWHKGFFCCRLANEDIVVLSVMLSCCVCECVPGEPLISCINCTLH